MFDVNMMIRNDESAIDTEIYHKPTDTEQYLNWNSHHPVSQKIGLVKTLYYRAETLISSEEAKKKEKENIRKALRRCNYPEWALKEGQKKSEEKKQNETSKEVKTKEKKDYVVLPYIKGVSERIERCFGKRNI